MDGGLPVGGRHYPSGFRQFEEWFDGEPAARAYLEAVRFRNGQACPRCGARRLRRHPTKWWCPDCRSWVTVTAGTLLEHTRIPVHTWLDACWHITSTKVGVSALSLERLMGIDYATAWSMLHKLRAAMDRSGRDRLTGEVEVDETYVGGREVGDNRGRSRGKKQVVIVACERETPTAMGRIRLGRLPDASGLSLRRFIEESIEPGTVVVTDAWPGYPVAFELLAAGGLHYTHKAVNLSVTTDAANIDLPHVHRVAALLKRWLLGTHQGSVELQHLDAYLDEYVFRFNRRRSNNRGLLFWRLVCGLVDHPPLTRAQLRQRKGNVEADDASHFGDWEAFKEERDAERTRARTRQQRQRAAAVKQALADGVEPPPERVREDPF